MCKIIGSFTAPSVFCLVPLRITPIAMSPDLRRKVDANRAARLAMENATKQQTDAQLSDPDSQKPVWADSPRS
ncbi:hypothetical protein AcV5_005945 [Taiwanofungus camphoratus]|nr:hypothetical protein AcW2_004386 [Antrodia cinnamomea]KAI0933934.1 hypothetical protein AcV5_005945 [Antrodia cinnamomea]KAI0948274.1 hypothetical protein AcV7_009071 [Antrodia cinnamomea]